MGAKTVLVTGGGRRLGAATVTALVEAGWTALVHVRTATEEAEALLAGLAERHQHDVGRVISADLSTPEGVAGLAAAVLADPAVADGLGGLVHNASIFFPSEGEGAPSDMAQARRDLWMLHVEAPVMLTEALSDALAQGSGSIVSMVDTSWGKAWPHLGDYSASKAALRQRTLGWALDLAPEVRANAVAPGAILSADWEQAAFAETVARLPLKRSGRPEDIASAVHYLLEAPYVTGQVLAVGGGWGLV